MLTFMNWLVLLIAFISISVQAKADKSPQTFGVLTLIYYNLGQSFQSSTWIELTSNQATTNEQKWVYNFEERLAQTLLSQGFFVENPRKRGDYFFLGDRFKKKSLTHNDVRELARIYGSNYVVWGQINLREQKVHYEFDVYRVSDFNRVLKVQLVDHFDQASIDTVIRLIDFSTNTIQK